MELPNWRVTGRNAEWLLELVRRTSLVWANGGETGPTEIETITFLDNAIQGCSQITASLPFLNGLILYLSRSSRRLRSLLEILGEASRRTENGRKKERDAEIPNSSDAIILSTRILGKWNTNYKKTTTTTTK